KTECIVKDTPCKNPTLKYSGKTSLEDVLVTDPFAVISAIPVMLCFGMAKIIMFFRKTRKIKLRVEKEQGTEKNRYSYFI
ncbi:MAG: hypothetical protein R2764_25685, partial [Bacteroidales bacterium]